MKFGARASSDKFPDLQAEHNTNCCGLVEVYGFPTLRAPLDKSGVVELETAIALAVANGDEGFNRKAVAFITLTDQQKLHLQPALVALGFSVGASGRNNTGNNITIYTHAINEPPVVKPRTTTITKPTTARRRKFVAAG